MPENLENCAEVFSLVDTGQSKILLYNISHPDDA